MLLWGNLVKVLVMGRRWDLDIGENVTYVAAAGACAA